MKKSQKPASKKQNPSSASVAKKKQVTEKKSEKKVSNSAPDSSNRILIWTVSIVLAQAVGFLSAFFAGDTKKYYLSQTLPPLAPPAWLFGMVWPILYLLIAVAAAVIYEQKSKKNDTLRQSALVLYGLQLGVNFFWSITFFRLDWQWGSVFVIGGLYVLAALTTVKFYQLNKKAGYLMLPYLAWLLFATYLNIGMVVLS